MLSEAEARDANSASLRVSRGFATAGEPVTFTCDGAAIEGLAGETLAARLVGAGRTAFHPNGTVAARGLFCGMGVCRECLVSVDSEPNMRACMTPLKAGMHVELRQPVRTPSAWIALGDRPVESPDVLVIGGGPAGASACWTSAPVLAVSISSSSRRAIALPHDLTGSFARASR